jgi:hypothetical protein
MHNRIPRRASRNLTPWQRFKRWWHKRWYSGAVIRFDKATRKGMMIAYRYPDSNEEDIK